MGYQGRFAEKNPQKPRKKTVRILLILVLLFVLVIGAAAVFGYGLDLICAIGISPEVSIIGQIVTVLALMCGSSAISEIIAKIKQ